MSADVQRKLGQRVGTLRKVRELTQEQLAERCGFTSKSISEIERGRVNVPLGTLATIARNLGVTLSEITLGVDGSVPREVRSLEQLLAGRSRKEHAAIAKVL